MFGIDTFFGSHELIALKLMDIFPVEEKATQLEEFAVHAFHEGRRYEEDKFAKHILQPDVFEMTFNPDEPAATCPQASH